MNVNKSKKRRASSVGTSAEMDETSFTYKSNNGKVKYVASDGTVLEINDPSFVNNLNKKINFYKKVIIFNCYVFAVLDCWTGEQEFSIVGHPN